LKREISNSKTVPPPVKRFIKPYVVTGVTEKDLIQLGTELSAYNKQRRYLFNRIKANPTMLVLLAESNREVNKDQLAILMCKAARPFPDDQRIWPQEHPELHLMAQQAFCRIIRDNMTISVSSARRVFVTSLLRVGFSLEKAMRVESCNARTIARMLAHSGLTWRSVSAAAVKLPDDWELKGKLFAQRVASAVKEFHTPPHLVWNCDETPVLLFISRSRAYARKGAVLLKSVGTRTKHAVTVNPVLSAAGELLWMQVIASGQTSAVFHDVSMGSDVALVPSKSNSYMQTSDTWIEFLADAAERAEVQIKAYNNSNATNKCQKVVLIVDVAPAHNSKQTLEWIKSEAGAKVRSVLAIVWVPPNCTEKLQPLDVIFNRSFKQSLRNCMESALWNHVYGDEQKQEYSISDEERSKRLKQFMGKKQLMTMLLSEFLPQAVEHVRARQSEGGMLSKSWALAGLHDAVFSPDSVDFAPIPGTEMWPKHFYQMVGWKPEPIDNIGASELREFCRHESIAGAGKMKVAELRSVVLERLKCTQRCISFDGEHFVLPWADLTPSVFSAVSGTGCDDDEEGSFEAPSYVTEADFEEQDGDECQDGMEYEQAFDVGLKRPTKSTRKLRST
jgi:hypothetical protein